MYWPVGALPGRRDNLMSDDGQRRSERLIGGVIVTLLLVGCLVVLLPFMSALLWAVVLSFSSWPLYRRALLLVGGRRTWAALLMTLGTTLVLLVPLLLVGISLADNVEDLATSTQQRLADGPPPPPSWVGKVPLVGGRISAYWWGVARDGKKFTQSLEPYFRPAFAWLMAGGLAV